MPFGRDKHYPAESYSDRRQVPPEVHIPLLLRLSVQHDPVGFAKVPSRSAKQEEAVSPEQAMMRASAALPGDQHAGTQKLGIFSSAMQTPSAGHALQQALNSSPSHPYILSDINEAPMPSPGELESLVRELSGPEDPDTDAHLRSICGPLTAREYVISLSEIPAPTLSASYFSQIPPVLSAESLNGRRRILEAPLLRDIRKRLDSGTASPAEVDAVAVNMFEDVVQLSSDYIGNSASTCLCQSRLTLSPAIIQRFFEKCTTGVRIALLERIAPYLAAIGCHKNGTWAAQK